MIKVALVGVTGYTGEELLKILVNHPEVEITSTSAKVDRPRKINEIFPHLCKKLDLICSQPDLSRIVPNCELAFLALPHRVSMEIAPEFLKAGKKVIDLSADYRLKDISEYRRLYGVKHKDSRYLKLAVYGLPEVHREKIRRARLIANPGCYPTGIIIGCLPFLKRDRDIGQNIIVDAKSGLSGAGREREAELSTQMKDSFCAYKVDEHQHAAEINQELSNFIRKNIEVIFIPHLIPIHRGILCTIYLKLKRSVSQKVVHRLYQDFYRDEPFVKILPEGTFPQIKDVIETNFCHIGLKVSLIRKTAIVICAIDNLIKGASGQAVQNMNIMCGFKETEGLI